MRLSVWVTISFGIAIATSQTANAWKAINNIDDNVYFLNCNYVGHGGGCSNPRKYNQYDGEMKLGHPLSCGQDQKECGAGKGQDIYVAVPLAGKVRLLYPPVYVNPHGMVLFKREGYITANDEHDPNIANGTVRDYRPPSCQKSTQQVVDIVDTDDIYDEFWVTQPTAILCDQAFDRRRAP